jgi:hypothetical protein
VEFGDFWHPSQMGPQEVAKMAGYLRRYSASVGRETPPQLSVRGRALTFSNTVASGDRLPLQGTTEDIIADVQEYAEAGVSHLIMEIAGDTYADKLRAMERFIKEVNPRVPA